MKRKLIVMSKDGKTKVEYDMETVQGIRVGKAVEEYGNEYCAIAEMKEDATVIIIEFKDGTEAGFEEDKWEREVTETEEEKPEEDLKEIWKQVEEKAVEKIERIMIAIENRDKEVMDRANEEYNRFLHDLSETTGINERMLDDRFTYRRWSRR